MGLTAHYTFDEQCTTSAAGCVKDSSGLATTAPGSATSGTLPQASIWSATGKFGWSYLYYGIVQPGGRHSHHTTGNAPAPRCRRRRQLDS